MMVYTSCNWCHNIIVKLYFQNALSTSMDDEVTKEEFIAFLKRALDKTSEEYAEIYMFLFLTFVEADVDCSTAVDLE